MKKRKLTGLLILLVLGVLSNTAMALEPPPTVPNPVCVYSIR